MSFGNPRPTRRRVCSQPGCTESFPDHAWGAIKADGWFLQRNGNQWCPDHHPEWVAAWRAKKARENDMTPEEAEDYYPPVDHTED